MLNYFLVFSALYITLFQAAAQLSIMHLFSCSLFFGLSSSLLNYRSLFSYGSLLSSFTRLASLAAGLVVSFSFGISLSVSSFLISLFYLALFNTLVDSCTASTKNGLNAVFCIVACVLQLYISGIRYGICDNLPTGC